MNADGIKRPRDWPFFDLMDRDLVSDINALIAAVMRDDPDIDCYLDAVAGSARCLPEEYDMAIRGYYGNQGYLSDANCSAARQDRKEIQ